MEVIDKEQCAAIWKQYEPYLRKICTVKLRNHPDEIDDIISEVFLALCKKVAESGYPEKPKAWLYGTLNNFINGKYREIYKEKQNTVDITEKEYILPYGIDFVDEIDDDLLLEQIKNALEKELSEKEKILLRIIYEDELRMKEIALLYQTSESAVKQQHYRLCKHIRAIAKKFIE